SREQAHGALRAMRPMSLALLEQPVEASDLEGLAWLRERTDVKIAADEAVRSLEDVEALLDLGAVDTLVLKPMAIGGLLRARAMQRRAAQAGVSTIYTTLLDGAIGRRAVTHLAAATDTLEGPCGLATGELFERDVVDTPARPVRGVLVLDERARGLGCEPSGWVFGDGARAPDEEGAAPIRIPLPLAHRATYMAGRDALVAGGVARSYEALYDMACALARALARAGIRPGDRVAVMAENSVELVALIHGLTLLGAPFVAVHPRSSAQEALALLERAQPALWVMDAPSAHRLSAHVGGAPCPRVSLAELARAPQEADVVLRQEVGLDEVCAVLFTSGTTGAPKMVALTWQNIVFSATGSAIQLGHMPTDRWLDVLPMCHVAGLSIVMRCAILGTSVVLHEGWDPARAARAIAAGEVTMVSLVSRMLWDVLDVMTREGLSAHPSFRLVLLGGGAIPEELLARALEVGVPVAPTYGMTEATSQIATASPYLPRAPRTVGAPLVWTQLEVRPGAPGEDAGEVAVRGPTVVRGYSRIARGRLETDALEDGWFFTGDWASRGDGEAWEGVEIVDRRMDVVVTGGENVYPAEVEAVLLQHEAVAEACVVGRSDQHWGQRVEAVCVAAEAVQDPEEQTDDVIERARTQLAGFKIPRRVHWWRELPKSTLGKVKRAQVRAKIESQGVDAT
ncbi:MAG: AMP-binding protein, partial [Myxococcota bacterium]